MSVARDSACISRLRKSTNCKFARCTQRGRRSGAVAPTEGQNMQRIMLRQAIGTAVIAALAASLAACGGGGSSSASSTSSTSSTSGTSGTSGGTPPTSMATMPLMVSDAPSDDWACIGVKLLSVALIPQGGGSAVTVWTA